MELLLLKKKETMTPAQYLFTLQWGDAEKTGYTSSCVMPVDKDTFSRLSVGEKVHIYFK